MVNMSGKKMEILVSLYFGNIKLKESNLFFIFELLFRFYLIES